MLKYNYVLLVRRVTSISMSAINGTFSLDNNILIGTYYAIRGLVSMRSYIFADHYGHLLHRFPEKKRHNGQ